MNITDYDGNKFKRAFIKYHVGNKMLTFNKMIVQSVSGMHEKTTYKIFTGQQSTSSSFWIKKMGETPDIKNISLIVPIEYVDEFIENYKNYWRISKSIIRKGITFVYKDIQIVGYMVSMTVQEQVGELTKINIDFYAKSVSEAAGSPDDNKLNFQKWISTDYNSCKITYGKEEFSEFLLNMCIRQYKEKYQIITTGRETGIVAYGHYPTGIAIRLYIPNVAEVAEAAEKENEQSEDFTYYSYKKHLRDFIKGIYDAREVKLYYRWAKNSSTDEGDPANPIGNLINIIMLDGDYIDSTKPEDMINMRGVINEKYLY